MGIDGVNYDFGEELQSIISKKGGTGIQNDRHTTNFPNDPSN